MNPYEDASLKGDLHHHHDSDYHHHHHHHHDENSNNTTSLSISRAPVDSGDGPQFTDKDRFRLYRAILKFGEFELRHHDILIEARIEKMPLDLVRMEYDSIINRCKEIAAAQQAVTSKRRRRQLTEAQKLQDQLKVGEHMVSATEVLARIEFLKSLHLILTHQNGSIPELWNLQPAIRTDLPLDQQQIDETEALTLQDNNNCIRFTMPEELRDFIRIADWGVRWTAHDDNALMIGIYKYGFGNWQEMKADKRLSIPQVAELKYDKVKQRALRILKHLDAYRHNTTIKGRKNKKQPQIPIGPDGQPIPPHLYPQYGLDAHGRPINTIIVSPALVPTNNNTNNSSNNNNNNQQVFQVGQQIVIGANGQAFATSTNGQMIPIQLAAPTAPAAQAVQAPNGLNEGEPEICALVTSPCVKWDVTGHPPEQVQYTARLMLRGERRLIEDMRRVHMDESMSEDDFIAYMRRALPLVGALIEEIQAKSMNELTYNVLGDELWKALAEAINADTNDLRDAFKVYREATSSNNNNSGQEQQQQQEDDGVDIVSLVGTPQVGPEALKTPRMTHTHSAMLFTPQSMLPSKDPTYHHHHHLGVGLSTPQLTPILTPSTGTMPSPVSGTLGLGGGGGSSSPLIGASPSLGPGSSLMLGAGLLSASAAPSQAGSTIGGVGVGVGRHQQPQLFTSLSSPHIAPSSLPPPIQQGSNQEGRN